MNHLIPIVGDKQRVNVLDVGSGPYGLTLCEFANGLHIEVVPVDRRDFLGIIKQNMESLVFIDDSFDIVQCINALDHTKNARKAVEEMIRVAKDAVYIDCNLDQHSTTGGWHYWDAQQDGTFKNETDSFDLKDYGFKINFINNGGKSRYNRIIATLEKESK